jgi:serine/threonine protein kinase
MLSSHSNIARGIVLNIIFSDFGIAKYKEDKTMTAIGTIVNTAPEVLTGDRYTEKVDVYSYGVLLWELLTRKAPFADMSYFEIVTRVVSKKERLPIPGS